MKVTNIIVCWIITLDLSLSQLQNNAIDLSPTQNKRINSLDECECVPYFLCNDNVINAFGEGLLDIRFLRECDDVFHICCHFPQDAPVKMTPPKRKCGIRKSGVYSRITGNKNEATYAEFPWMVAILQETGIVAGVLRRNVYQCGGSLIHPQVVLTAAHCVYTPRNARLQILAGEWDTQTDSEPYPNQKRNISKIITHENFVPSLVYNDIAILILETPLDITYNVDVICLPKQDANFESSRECYASGWGRDRFEQEGRYQVILKKVELPVVPREKCITELRKTRLGQHFRLHISFMCAGGEKGKDTCEGDGGSPLICPISPSTSQYQQVGIVSWGIGCGSGRTPGVYANVALFRDWIDKTMRENNLFF